MTTRKNASRRNRALRKVRASRHLPPEIKATLQALIDLLSPKTGYRLAWPSAAYLARKTGKSRRTVVWHLAVIKGLGVFHVHQLSPQQAVDYAQSKYGVELKLDHCSVQAPNLFEVNAEHPLWDDSQTVPPAVDRDWGRLAEEVKSRRNARTTSRLSADPANRPRARTSEVRAREQPAEGAADAACRESVKLPRIVSKDVPVEQSNGRPRHVSVVSRRRFS